MAPRVRKNGRGGREEQGEDGIVVALSQNCPQNDLGFVKTAATLRREESSYLFVAVSVPSSGVGS